jgi:hypothetical protein
MNIVAPIQPMLSVLAHIEWETYLANAIANGLAEMGEAVFEPALAAHAASEDAENRFSLCEVLACCGAKDERIFALLRDFFMQDADLGATLFAIYGDPQALPYLTKELAAYESEHGDVAWAPEDLPSELVHAITELGGTLTAEQAKKQETLFTHPDYLIDDNDGLDIPDDDEEPGKSKDVGDSVS